MRPVVVFGDVHGRADQLELLVREVRSRFGYDVDIYSTGDLIDRGPDSKGVIDICIKEGIKANFGNHDQWLFEFCFRQIFDPSCLLPGMAGTATLSSYGVGWRSFYQKYPDDKDVYKAIANTLWKKIPEDHKAFFLSMEPYRKVWVGDDEEIYWLIHAGLKEPIARKYKAQGLSDDEMMEKMPVNNLLWPFPKIGRDEREGVDLYQFEEGTQILGHTVCRVPIIGEGYIAIDTGCGTKAPYTLSAIVLPTMEIIQVRQP
jgi:serine/threonine protein phosphatase 1